MSYIDNLSRFLKQANKGVDLATNYYDRSYKDLAVTVSFGVGNFAKIPWIAFLGEGQKVMEGIYPVYLYYKKEKLLILAYGISETRAAHYSWSIKDLTTINDYFKSHGLGKPWRYGASFVFKAYPNIKESDINASFDNDLDEIISTYKTVLSAMPTITTKTPVTATPTTRPAKSTKTMTDSIIDAVSKSGLMYDNLLVKRYIISLLTKPFVILSGLSGSGKTQLSIAVAKALCHDYKKQVQVVPVGADWTNREPLLGYPNALKKNDYTLPESKALQLVLAAAKDEKHPYFLILDEMNLSYVERYFADFLSALESHEDIPLWTGRDKDIPNAVSLPKNLFIVGTINVDETTYMFSPKVLDRANVIEFKVNEEEMSDFLQKSPVIDISVIEGAASGVAEEFVKTATEKASTNMTSTKDVLLSFFRELKKVNAEFGYRSASEIERFIALAETVGSLTEEESIDSAIVQKLLPKLHGSRKKLVPILKALWEKCETGAKLEDVEAVPAEAKLPLTADKILRMYNGAVDNGFTSFSEA